MRTLPTGDFSTCPSPLVVGVRTTVVSLIMSRTSPNSSDLPERPRRRMYSRRTVFGSDRPPGDEDEEIARKRRSASFSGGDCELFSDDDGSAAAAEEEDFFINALISNFDRSEACFSFTNSSLKSIKSIGLDDMINFDKLSNF